MVVAQVGDGDTDLQFSLGGVRIRNRRANNSGVFGTRFNAVDTIISIIT